MKISVKKIGELFFTFFKIGAFTFGGGYAMIPLIEKETVDKKKWIKSSDILDIVAVAESTPGPIAINSATFIGYKICGIVGAAVATLGVVLPSFLIIYGISFVLKQFDSFDAVKFAFNGIRAGVLALIVKALVSMYKECPKNLFSYIIMGVAFAVAAFVNINVICLIIGCATAGVVFTLISERRVKS